MADNRIDRLNNPIRLFLLILIAIFLIFRCSYLFLSDPQRFPIDVVKVKSPFQFINRQTIEHVIAPYLTNSFFTLPVHQLQNTLMNIQGIEDISVERRWPDELILHITEKKPVAKWHNKLITLSGDSFIPTATEPLTTYPELVGPEKNKKDILHTYQKLSKILSSYGFLCEKLTFESSTGWQLQLKDDMLIILGNQQVASRLKRFLSRLPAIKAESSAKIQYADLRYKHGVAVKYES